MKKSKILRLFLTFICLIAISLVGNNVYGYQLKYKAFYNNEESKTKGYVVLRTMGNTYGSGGNVNGSGYLANDNMNSFSEIENASKNMYGISFERYYQTYGIVLHNDYLSNYPNDPSKAEYKMGYDYGDVDLSDSKRGLRSGISNSIGYVSNKNTSSVTKVYNSLDGDTFKVYKTWYVYANGISGQKVTITDWLLSENWLKEKLNNNKNLFKTSSDGGKYTYVSLSAYTAGPSSELIDKYGSDNADKAYKNQPGDYFNMDTSYNALRVVYNYDYWEANKGLANGKSKKSDTDSLANVGQTIMNLYDNELVLPKNLTSNHKVYVRHVDKNGNILDSNDAEILISNGNKSVKNNMTIPDGDKAKGIFSEYYEINSGETLDVSRLLNLVKDGEYYELEGVKTSTANTYDDALKNEKNAREQNLDKVSVSAGDNSQVTVITFRYNKKSANPEPDPKGGVDTLEAGNTGEDCQMSYTPTNSNIKPYLVANKVKFLNLKYEYVIENNEVKYNSIIFNVNKLVSGNFGDNDDVKYKDNVGKIFGNSEDKETLLDGNSPQTFTVSNDIDEDLNDIRRVGTLPTSSELKKIADKKTNKDDSSTYYKVPSNRYNGLRIPKLTANYQEYNILNSNTGEVESTDVNNTVKVLVYNPIKVGGISVKSEGVVDHSTGEKNNTVIQKNANFELNIGEVSGEPYVGHTYNEYLDKYYLIFDISIIKTDKTDYANLYQVSGNELRTINVGNNGEIPRGTIIELKKEQKTFYGKAGQTNTSDKISQNASQITLIGSSNNMPSDWLKSYVLRYEKNNLLNSEMVKNYISNETNSSYKLGTDINGSSTDVKLNYCDGNIDYTKYKVHDSLAYDGKDMYGDAYYFAKSTTSITNIGRIYDFKITDCSDIDYKKVFRITTGNKVNFLTGVEYFSGIKKFSIFSSDVNTLEDREEVKSVSSSSKTILPLGPYKNTDSSYVNAPKMGYRVSFDLKTSGYYNYTTDAKNSKREIKITPSYYYISKDGQTYKSNIDLYYKNSDGKYVKFVGSDYTIYFKPKDGYRTKSNSVITSQNKFMSEQLEPLKIGSSEGFTLDYKMMNTSNDNFIQSWYGEFKLPNSTIATENGNISKPLTDGYVGVKFNIECIDTDSSSNVKTISYNTNNKNASPDTNTSQWDYEGYLGFSNPGSAAGDISIQLEKGTWTVNDNNSGSKAKYTDIKGTVALFDLDNRAANDFD